MPNDLISTDPLIAQNFFLEIDGGVVSMLSGVSGLDLEVEVASTTQVGKDGKAQTVKTLGNANKAPDVTLTRMAAIDGVGDPMWKWFNDIRSKGLKVSDRAGGRKNGSIVVYDSANSEVARFNFFNAWPSKIATDALSAESNDAVKENITLICERLERVK